MADVGLAFGDARGSSGLGWVSPLTLLLGPSTSGRRRSVPEHTGVIATVERPNALWAKWPSDCCLDPGVRLRAGARRRQAPRCEVVPDACRYAPRVGGVPMPMATAIMAACVRLVTPSLRNTAARWAFTVFSDRYSCREISRLLDPPARSWRTSASRR